MDLPGLYMPMNNTRITHIADKTRPLMDNGPNKNRRATCTNRCKIRSHDISQEKRALRSSLNGREDACCLHLRSMLESLSSSDSMVAILGGHHRDGEPCYLCACRIWHNCSPGKCSPSYRCVSAYGGSSLSAKESLCRKWCT